FRRDHSSHLARGSVAAFDALQEARRLLADEGCRACLIAAVDTFVDARTLAWLDETRRLKTTEQTDGVIPGGGACAMLAAPVPVGGWPRVVRGLGFAAETATVLNEEPFLGKGMAAAVRGALGEAGVAIHEVAFRLSDVAGESYAFEELVL